MEHADGHVEARPSRPKTEPWARVKRPKYGYVPDQTGGKLGMGQNS